MRELTYSDAILEGTNQLMKEDSRVSVLGLGVPTKAGVFGTTTGLIERYGKDRVIDLPAAENGMTGVAVGMAISGIRPIFVHHRVDFAVLALEPLVNQAAKWFYMYGGETPCPLTVRAIIGRGWGQGPQHSQSLQAWFGHVPGLKVVMPTTPADAKGLLIAAVHDPAPVVILEHRWLYDIKGHVPLESVKEPLGVAKVLRQGADLTLISSSYMTLECLRAAEILESLGISAEVIDLRTTSPIDHVTVRASASKTGHLIAVDGAHRSFSLTSEILSLVVESGVALKSAPRRICLPDAPTPTTPALADLYYPRAIDIARSALNQRGRNDAVVDPDNGKPLDQPSAAFTGPY